MLFLLLEACHQGNTSGQPDIASTDTISKQMDSSQKRSLPVADYLHAEISYVDSIPLAIRKYTVQSGKTDSSFIQLSEFNQLASQFLVPELSPGTLEKDYTENSFQDETTGYFTFTYSPRDKDLPLQRVDVLTTPDKGASKVNGIFLERITRSGDTLIAKKMYWKARHNFLVITSLQLPKKEPVVNQLKVVWESE